MDDLAEDRDDEEKDVSLAAWVKSVQERATTIDPRMQKNKRIQIAAGDSVRLHLYRPGHGVLIGMLLAAGLYGLHQASAINERVKNLYTQELVPLETVDDMKASFYRVRDRVGRHLMEPERQAVHEAKIREQLERLRRNEAKYRESRLSEEELRLLDAYAEAWKRYLELIDNEVLPLSRAGKVEEAEKVLYGPALQAFRAAREAINALADYQVRRAKRRFDNAQAAYAEMRSLTLFLIVAGLVVAGGLGWHLARSIRRPLLEVRQVLRRLDQGDLTGQVSYRSADELGQMANDLNNAIATQRELVAGILQTVEQIAAAGETMSAVTGRTRETVQGQQRETEQLATAMNEMTATVQEVARNIAQTAESAHEANRQTGEGSEVVQQAVARINELAEQIEASARKIESLEKHSETIGSVVEVIRGVAEQTNLLALNAAIEAARAGDQGRGFAVVADEVRTLAGRTQESTEEIQGMVEQLQAVAREAVEVMRQSQALSGSAVDYAARSGEALKAIAEAVGRITDMSGQIATAAEEQSAVAEEINRNVVRINDMASQTARGAEETARASEELAQMAGNLKGLVARFQV